MKPAPIKENEAARLAALHRYDVLDTLPEAEFDDFTQLASHICGTPIALISLVDGARQWFKSRRGLDTPETARDISFCGHAIHGVDIFEIPDALQDPRFADNPLVTGEPGVRYYAGAPLITPDGHGIGVLCVIDRVAHRLTAEQSASLAALARQVIRQMELRLAVSLRSEVNQANHLLANLLNATTELSIIATDPDGTITLFNRGAEQLLGYRADEMVGLHSTLDLHVPAELAARAAELSRQLGRPITGFEIFTAIPRQQGSERQKWHKIHKDGNLVPVMLSVTATRSDAGEITGYFSIALDISDEILASTAISAARVGIWDYQVQKDVLTWDDVMFQLYGVKQENFAGRYQAWQAGVHPDDKERSDMEIAQALTGEKPLDTEYRVVWPDGSLHWIRARATVQCDINGVVLRMTGTNWDISAQKQAEQAKTEFVSTVSHELRTPLTSISGALGLIVGGTLGAVPPNLRQMLDIAHKNSVRLSHLINDLLDMEKMLAGKIRFDFETQPLLPLVEQAIDAIRPYGEPLQVTFAMTAFDAETTLVRVDGMRLQQVLSNFMSNAAKFSPRGSQIAVRVRCQNAVARVEVKDCGAGIAPEFHGRIFQKFSQADSSDTRQKGGTGLGLAISKEIIERMNGKIGFTSEAGQGACFYFELPILQAQVAQAPAAPEPENLDDARILVVERDPDVAQLLMQLLQRSGYKVDIALSGEVALILLARHRYAAITLDMMLPDWSGVALIRRIRSMPETAALPVVVVSAAMENGKLSIGGDFSAIDWLDKPIAEGHLIAAIQRATLGRVRQRPRVLHVEDDADLRDIVAVLGADVADFDVAYTLEQARGMLDKTQYNAVVLDVGLPDGNGLELLPLLKALDPEPSIIVLSGLELNAEQQSQVNAAMVKSRTSNEHFLNTLERLIANSRY